jgi:hypothetical protein
VAFRWAIRTANAVLDMTVAGFGLPHLLELHAE